MLCISERQLATRSTCTAARGRHRSSAETATSRVVRGKQNLGAMFAFRAPAGNTEHVYSCAWSTSEHCRKATSRVDRGKQNVERISSSMRELHGSGSCRRYSKRELAAQRMCTAERGSTSEYCRQHSECARQLREAAHRALVLCSGRVCVAIVEDEGYQYELGGNCILAVSIIDSQGVVPRERDFNR